MTNAQGVVPVPGSPQPATWGKDGLSEYLETAYRNRIATFANKRDEYSRLVAIDDCFSTVTTGWLNPPQLIPALLFIRTLGSYRAACEAAMAGAVVEAFVMIRAMLEAAGYAAHIGHTPSLSETWLSRHDSDPKVAKAAREKFTIGEVRRSISVGNQHAAELFHRLYNEAIDFGAHPNERGITGNMTITDVPNGTQFQHVLLQGDGLQMDYALITTARAGLCSLDILQTVFPERYELLRMIPRMLKLRQGV